MGHQKSFSVSSFGWYVICVAGNDFRYQLCLKNNSRIKIHSSPYFIALFFPNSRCLKLEIVNKGTKTLGPIQFCNNPSNRNTVWFKTGGCHWPEAFYWPLIFFSVPEVKQKKTHRNKVTNNNTYIHVFTTCQDLFVYLFINNRELEQKKKKCSKVL